MCISMCAQVLYGVIMVACLILTLAAMFTSNWRQIDTELDNMKNDVLRGKVPDHMGIFPFACRMPGDNSTKNSTDTGLKYCEQWWNNLPTWEKVVIGAMVVAVLLEAFAVIWNFFTCCACCCKQLLLHPLTLAALLTSVALAVAVVVYGVNNKTAFDGVDSLHDIESKIKSAVGYSFWMAVGALVLAVVDTIVGVFAACMGQTCL
ncbi:hypothetical protein Q1695_001222 [Nippostrongylus brasiliensis]|nr:hypothetical protein Q1695_001222 [Nippostrongylus brasiliensis]